MVMGVVVAVVVALFLVRRRKTGLGDKYSMARNDIGLGKPFPPPPLYDTVQVLDFLFTS